MISSSRLRAVLFARFIGGIPPYGAASAWWRPDRFTLLLAALAALGAVLILARQVTYGVGLRADWAAYLSAAQNLSAGEGFVQIHGWPYLHWPPLYPLLLAAAGFFVLAPYDVAGPLNAAVFGLTLFVAGQYLRRHVRHPFLVIWACLAIMLAIPLTRMASHAVSEVPFILFVTLSLIRTSAFLDSGKRADLIWAAAFASLAYLTRYIGVTLIITTLPLLIFRRGDAPLEKAKRIGLYLSIAALPTALWLLRNVLLHGRWRGRTGPSPHTLPEILDKFLSDLARWVLPYLPFESVRTAAAALAGIVLLALAISVGHAFVRSRLEGGERRRVEPFHLFGGFALAYFVFLTAAQVVLELTPLGDRHLSPMYIPLLFAAVFALDKFLENRSGLPVIQNKITRGRGGWLAVTLVTTLSLWTAGLAALNVYEIKRNNEGRGMGMAAVLVNSETLRYVEEHLMAERIFSNAASAIYIRANHADYHDLPLKLDTLREHIENAAPGAYVAWMDLYWMDSKEKSRYIPVLSKLLGLELTAELSDGSIYRVTRSGADPAPAYFVSAVAPTVGELFGVKLSDRVECGHTRYQSWQWERGGDELGWTKVTPRWAAWQYRPTAADVGLRLRAYAYCTDKDGKTIRAMTAPSAPVLKAYDSADSLR